jgi:hypothetical protein
MTRKKSPQPVSAIPDEVSQQARSFIEQAFRFFRTHFSSLSRDLEKVDSEHRAIKERINRGARRTDGRIV